ncbi:NmrA family NAD(P)-binding protein [Yinghuangia soli]|uniref:NAD(P)H-binding protein n=1 Tax=Yinghuangia soli TaxID=2908204 RepID=A0AA41U0C4_9ACTN|nr:NAD(P)H-binding protein [Yinghuangia soli]MCF2526292.1 NAD(P)H-binding protein [Yinghuangia soli]
MSSQRPTVTDTHARTHSHTASDSAEKPAPIVVLGATGKTGRRVVEALARKGVPTRAVARSTTPLRFAWNERATWSPVLTGAAAVYLVEPDEEQVPLAEFVAQAVEHGVRRLVLLSARSRDAVNLAMKEPAESAVRASGTAWTILRPAWFNQNFTDLPLFAVPLEHSGELRLPTGEGREPFIDIRDIADVAAEALTTDGHAGRTYELTGPDDLTFGEALAQYARAVGRDLRYVPVSEAEYAADYTAAGAPTEEVELVNSLFRVIREGGGAGVTDHVREVLGRGPRPFAAWLETPPES